MDAHGASWTLFWMPGIPWLEQEDPECENRDASHLGAPVVSRP